MKIERFKQYVQRHRRFCYSIFIFVIIFCCLYLPFFDCGFYSDDFGIIRHVLDVGFRKIGMFFYEGETVQATISTLSDLNHPILLNNFLGGLYRPMVFVYSLLQVHLFGLNPSVYFFVTIFLHAINSVFLFNIIYTFQTLSIALILSLLFAFHSSFYTWFGWFTGQQYIIELTCLIFILLTMRKYILSQKIGFYFLSVFLFLLNIFQREMMIVFPFWVVFFCSVYNFKDNNISLSIVRGVKLASGYFFAIFIYIISRGLVFSFNVQTTSNTTLGFDLNFKSFLLKINARFYDFVTTMSDYLGLRILPPNHQFIKGSLIILFISVLIFMFIRNRQKGLVALMFVSGVMFSWIPILLIHSPRYIYVGLFFFIICFALLCGFAEIGEKYKKYLFILVLSYTCINYAYLAHGMELRRCRDIEITQNFKELGIEIKSILKKSKNFKHIYLDKIPCFYTFAEQAIRLYSDNPPLRIYSFEDKPQADSNYLVVAWNEGKDNFDVKVIN